MKKIVFITVSLIISLSSFSQGKYGATPKDSVTCIEALSIYKENMKIDPKVAMEYWRIAYRVCPQSQKSLYINGVKLYKALARKTKDEAQKSAYIDTMLSIYDQRIEMFGQKGFVLGQKGQTMLATGQDRDSTYKVLSEAISLTGNKTQSGTLVALMYAIINLEKTNKCSKEEVVEMFEKTMAICAVNKPKPKGGKRYAKAEEKIGNVTSPYLDCTVLVPLAEKNFEDNKENVDWLRRTMLLLKRNKCFLTDDGAAIFGKVAEAYFAIEPSADGADAIAKIFQNKKQYKKAIEWFNKAAGMAETNDEKAEYTLSVAKVYSYSKSFAQARTYALKAAAFKKGWGKPYLLIGDCYAQSSKTCDDGKLGKYGVYWAAIDKYKKAKAIDSSVASDANRKIANISARYPTTKDVFFYSKKNGDSYTVKCWINETTTIRTR